MQHSPHSSISSQCRSWFDTILVILSGTSYSRQSDPHSLSFRSFNVSAKDLPFYDFPAMIRSMTLHMFIEGDQYVHCIAILCFKQTCRCRIFHLRAHAPAAPAMCVCHHCEMTVVQGGEDQAWHDEGVFVAALQVTIGLFRSTGLVYCPGKATLS